MSPKTSASVNRRSERSSQVDPLNADARGNVEDGAVVEPTPSSVPPSPADPPSPRPPSGEESDGGPPQPHHILLLVSDLGHVVTAARRIPRERSRPKLRRELYPWKGLRKHSSVGTDQARGSVSPTSCTGLHWFSS